MIDRTADFTSPTDEAGPPDAATPESTVLALYDTISGPEGEERDWDRLRALFDPRARFLIGRWLADPQRPRDVVYEWDLDAFIVEGRKHWLPTGFWETQLRARVEVYGNVAHVFSSYESRAHSAESEPIGRGGNSVQLLRHGGRWWIVGIVWDVETPESPLPLELQG